MCIRCHGNTSTITAADLLYNQYIRYFRIRNYLVTIYKNCTCNGSNVREYVSTSMPYYSRFLNDNLLRGNTIQDSWNLSIFLYYVSSDDTRNMIHTLTSTAGIIDHPPTDYYLCRQATPWQLKLTAPKQPRRCYLQPACLCGLPLVVVFKTIYHDIGKAAHCHTIFPLPLYSWG